MLRVALLAVMSLVLATSLPDADASPRKASSTSSVRAKKPAKKKKKTVAKKAKPSKRKPVKKKRRATKRAEPDAPTEPRRPMP